MFSRANIPIGNAVDYYKRQGLLPFLKRVLIKLGFEHFNRTLIFVILNMDNVPDDMEKPYTFHIATIEDIQNDRGHNYGYFTKKEAIDRIQIGHDLFLHKENEQPVYFSWVEQKLARIDLFRMPLNLPSSMAYHSGEYTRPDYRNKGITTRTKKDIFRYLKRTGIQYVVGVIQPDNLIARNIAKRMGYQEYQVVNYQRYWQIRRYTVQKCNSDEHKTFITLFKAPRDLWKTYLKN